MPENYNESNGGLLHPYQVWPRHPWHYCVLSGDALCIDGGTFLAGNCIVVEDKCGYPTPETATYLIESNK